MEVFGSDLILGEFRLSDYGMVLASFEYTGVSDDNLGMMRNTIFGRQQMKLNKNDIIKEGENIYTVFCTMGSVVYVKYAQDVNSSPTYELEEVLKHYRKMEIMEK